MEVTLSTLLSYILLYKYFALFVITFSAAILLPLPTDTMLVAIGAFAYQGYFSFWLAFTITVGSEMLGDYIDFYIAKKYGHVLLREKYARKYSFFTKLETFFQQYTGLTIIFTRFVGILSPLTNFLAGFEKIKTSKFLFYDFLGNAADTIMLLTTGYIIGDNWETISEQVGWVGGIVAVGLLAFFVYTMWRRKIARHDKIA